MKRSLTSEAEEELTEAALWYDDRREGLGVEPTPHLPADFSFLVAAVPVLGWWDQRRGLKIQEMSFSLVVSVFGPGVYTAIKPRVEAGVAIPVEL